MSSLPTQRRISQSNSTDSWYSLSSHHSSTHAEPSRPADLRATGDEPVVDLNPSIPLSQGPPQPSIESLDVRTTSEKRKCWICLAEEGEVLANGTAVNTSRWSKACACSLDAHETCLITWINQSRGADASKNVASLIFYLC